MKQKQQNHSYTIIAQTLPNTELQKLRSFFQGVDCEQAFIYIEQRSFKEIKQFFSRLWKHSNRHRSQTANKYELYMFCFYPEPFSLIVQSQCLSYLLHRSRLIQPAQNLLARSIIFRWFSFLLILAFMMLRYSWFSYSSSCCVLTAASGSSFCRLSSSIRLNQIEPRLPRSLSQIGFSNRAMYSFSSPFQKQLDFPFRWQPRYSLALSSRTESSSGLPARRCGEGREGSEICGVRWVEGVCFEDDGEEWRVCREALGRCRGRHLFLMRRIIAALYYGINFRYQTSILESQYFFQMILDSVIKKVEQNEREKLASSDIY